MNYLLVDISGRCPNYDIALCDALHKVLLPSGRLKLFATNINPDEVECDCCKLINFIPRNVQKSKCIAARAIKACLVLLNYLYLTLLLLFSKADVLHFQWLPLIEVSSVEKFLLKFMRFVSPKTKFVLTIHNIYPHDCNEKGKDSYKKRFASVEVFFDKFIVHLKTSKNVFCSDFNISENRVKVFPHGVFSPKDLKVVPHKRGEKLNLIMYGNQSYYKGTDILVDALAMLPKEKKNKVHTLIVGKTDPDYLDLLKAKARDSDITFNPEFISDDDLYKSIMKSDIIVVPYREISQSGVLLLALSFKRMIVVSDIPSFRETLGGFDSDAFFESDNPASLSKLITKYIDGLVDEKKQLRVVDDLVNRLSWEKIAELYINLF